MSTIIEKTNINRNRKENATESLKEAKLDYWKDHVNTNYFINI